MGGSAHARPSEDPDRKAARLFSERAAAPTGSGSFHSMTKREGRGLAIEQSVHLDGN
jgi:hypothetical protein